MLVLIGALALPAGVAPAAAQRQPGGPACSQPLADPITIVNVPGGSANPTLSRDGCWLFVMVNRPPADGGAGVAVLRRSDRRFTPVRTVRAPFSNPMNGMLLTNDQELLVVAAAGSLTFIDVEKATTGDTDPVLGQMQGLPGAFRLTVTPDDTHLFVPQFGPARVAILDLARARASRFAADSLVAGVIPTGRSPITAVVSPDGRHVYSTNLVAPDVLAGPLTCIDGKQREGGIQIKADVGVEVAFADMGGWDHHSNETQQLTPLLREFGASLAAFARDMGDRMEDIVLVTMSEFGRTTAENGNGGTDHGHGDVMLVMGGPVRGGAVYGTWPGLEPEQLFERRDLAVETDFRDVLGELVQAHLSQDTAHVFPNYRARSLGLLRGS